jgi:hypothetical protein
MLIDFKTKKIFVAVPKTGTTALENHILSISNKFERNVFMDNSRKLNPVPKHISISEIKYLLNEEFWNYKFIAIIREPFDCTISKYRFYKYGRPNQRIKEEPKKQSFRKLLKIKLAHILPFDVWILVYPLNINLKYIQLNNNIPSNLKCYTFDLFKTRPDIIYNNLLDDNFHVISTPVVNKTKSNITVDISSLSKFILKLKLRKENKFYNMIKENESL